MRIGQTVRGVMRIGNVVGRLRSVEVARLRLPPCICWDARDERLLTGAAAVVVGAVTNAVG